MKHLKRFEDYDFGIFNEDVQDNELNNEIDNNTPEIVEEIVEKKKMNAGFKAYLDKQKGKKADKECKDDAECKDDKADKKDKKDDKADDKEEKSDAKGLTAKQKKLPKAMQDAILKKQKK